LKVTARLLLFSSVLLALAVTILLGPVVRQAAIPDELALIPRQSELLVAAGDIRSLWEQFDYHFGTAARRDSEETGFIGSGLARARDELEANGLKITSLEDLSSYGIDIEKGAGAGLNPAAGNVSTYFYLIDKDAFLDGLEISDWARLQPDALRRDYDRGTIPGDLEVLVNDDAESDRKTALAFTRAGPASLDVGPLQFQRGRLATRDNLEYFRRDDALYDGIEDVLRRPLGSGPSLYVFWDSALVPLIDRGVGALSMQAQEVRVDLVVNLQPDTLRIADDLLSEKPEPAAWARFLSPRTAALVVLEDREAAHYLEFLERSQGVRWALVDNYGGVLDEVRRLSGLRRILLAMTGWHAGLPELVMGIWADPRGLHDMVQRIRVRQRSARDRQILEAAAREFTANQKRAPVSVEALQQRGYLQPEPGALFDHYSPGSGGLQGTLHADDFDNDTYRRRHGEAILDFILPPVTPNDLRYRFDSRGLSVEEIEALQSDRHRLAAWLDGEILWVASDMDELEELVDRTSSPKDSLEDSLLFRTARSGWDGREKLFAYLNVDELTTLGMLSPESQIQEIVQTFLLDMQDHPVVSFSLEPDDTERGLRLALRMVHRTALGSR